MPHSVAFVFPGQGSQRVGMLDALPLRSTTREALLAAESLVDLPLRHLAQEGPASALADTRAAQPLLYLTDLSWAWALEDAGVRPLMVAGHSLGELAALTFAGVLPLEAGVELVSARARIMAEVAAAVPGTMAAVLGMERAAVASLLENIGGVWIANDNSAGQAVISGTHDGVERATEALAAAGARKVVPLDVAGPFHCPLMAPARDAFAEVLATVEFREARFPVIQNTEPSPAVAPEVVRSRLADQITAPVRWRETMDVMVANGVSLSVEAGPGAVLTGLARRVEGLDAIAAETEGIGRVLEVVGA